MVNGAKLETSNSIHFILYYYVVIIIIIIIVIITRIIIVIRYIPNTVHTHKLGQNIEK